MRYRRINYDRVKLFILEYQGESLYAFFKRKTRFGGVIFVKSKTRFARVFLSNVKPGLEAFFFSNVKPGLEALSSRQKTRLNRFSPSRLTN